MVKKAKVQAQVVKDAAQFILREANEADPSDDDTVPLDTQAMDLSVPVVVVKKTVKKKATNTHPGPAVKRRKVNVIYDEPEEEEEEGEEDDGNDEGEIGGEEEDEGEVEEVGGDEEDEGVEEEEDAEKVIKRSDSKLSAGIDRLRLLRDCNVLKTAYVNREIKVIKDPLVQDQVDRLTQLLADSPRPKGVSNNLHLSKCIKQIVLEEHNFENSLNEDEGVDESERDEEDLNEVVVVKPKLQNGQKKRAAKVCNKEQAKKGSSPKKNSVQVEDKKIEASLVTVVPQDKEGKPYDCTDGTSVFHNLHYYIAKSKDIASIEQIVIRRYYINKEGLMTPYSFSMSKTVATALLTQLPKLLQDCFN